MVTFYNLCRVIVNATLVFENENKSERRKLPKSCFVQEKSKKVWKVFSKAFLNDKVISLPSKYCSIFFFQIKIESTLRRRRLTSIQNSDIVDNKIWCTGNQNWGGYDFKNWVNRRQKVTYIEIAKINYFLGNLYLRTSLKPRCLISGRLGLAFWGPRFEFQA